MNDYQLAYLCDLIIDEYFYLQVDDFKYCFTKAIKGEYGIIYDRIDANIILGWLRHYANARCSAGAIMTIEERDQKLLELDKSLTYDDYLRSIGERAANGDESAIEALNRAKELAAFRKKIQPDYAAYKQNRGKKLF